MSIENFLYTLPFMAKGMAGIFVVTLVIVFCIAALNKLTANIGKKNESGENK